jgi:hypothetical protein
VLVFQHALHNGSFLLADERFRDIQRLSGDENFILNFDQSVAGVKVEVAGVNDSSYRI